MIKLPEKIGARLVINLYVHESKNWGPCLAFIMCAEDKDDCKCLNLWLIEYMWIVIFCFIYSKMQRDSQKRKKKMW